MDPFCTLSFNAEACYNDIHFVALEHCQSVIQILKFLILNLDLLIFLLFKPGANLLGYSAFKGFEIRLRAIVIDAGKGYGLFIPDSNCDCVGC